MQHLAQICQIGVLFPENDIGSGSVCAFGQGAASHSPTGFDYTIQETAVPVQNVGKGIIEPLEPVVASGRDGAGSVFIFELPVESIGYVEHELLAGHWVIYECCSSEEDVHAVQQIAVLVYVHGVFVVLETSPELADLASQELELIVKTPANHGHVGGLGEVVFAGGSSGTVQPVAEAVGEMLAETALDLQP